MREADRLVRQTGKRGSRPQGIPTKRLAGLAFGVGDSIAGTVYGTVVVMATITAAYANIKAPWRLAGLVAGTATVLWLAHMYAYALSETLVKERRLGRSELESIARRELGILLAAVAPTVALMLGAGGFFGEPAAVWVALLAGFVTLAAEGVRYARVARFGFSASLLAVSVNLGLGLVIVAFKVSLAH